MYKDATTHFEDGKVPLVHEVIPMINILSEELEKLILNDSHHPCTRVAAAKGYIILNKYYARTDSSIMYWLCMSESILISTLHLLIRC